MRGKPKKSLNWLNRFLLIQTIVIMISSVCIAELVDFIANYVVLGNPNYNPIIGVGMFFPMGILVGGISYAISKHASSFVTSLVAGLNSISKGNFAVRLDPETGGPISEVYADFNKMGAELQSVQTLKEDFINSFSHEFKTPITSINGFAKLLLEEDVPEDDKQKYLQIIADESSRLAGLANSSLLLSKLESQRFVLDKEPYSLDEQIKRCAILLSPEWNKKEIELSAELEPVTFNGNADLMQHVWINLLSNAIKFTPQQGEITVTLKAKNGVAIVTVSDTGKGMTEEEMARIFVKYYQGDPEHSKKGLGLGLSIIKRIVDLCGGKIDVKSTVNEGSTFTVCLPINN